MNFLEIVTYVATGFVPTLIAMELAEGLEHKRWLTVESNSSKIFVTTGNRSISES
jgi:hypothetical protein